MPATDAVTPSPSQLHTNGESPPRCEIPPQLAKELAKIIAEALVADYYADSLKTCAATSSPAETSSAPATQGAACE